MSTKSIPTGDSTPISNIVEAELRDHNGDLIGIVDELLIDLESGRIEYVLARGLRGARLQYPWRSITIEQGRFILQRSGPRLVVHGSGP
jgi:sporulation protein YlmC with PRC-barrel domain